MRTVAQVEPIDIHLLACLQREEKARTGPVQAEQIGGWRGDTVLLEPSLGALQRAGLVRLEVLMGGTAHRVTRYGHEFLDFLLRDTESVDPSD